ncbi:MAG: hypothetical protein AB7O04_09960, partial [Hyphomonadaceae bacterium]
LQAASNNVLASLSNTADIETHVGALKGFIDRLNDMAEGARGENLRMSSSEWLYVYRWYVAHVIETGSHEQIEDEAVEALLHRVAA